MKDRMRRIAALLLCLLMTFSLAACGNGRDNAADDESGTAPSGNNASNETPSADDAAGGFVVADTDEEIYMNNFGEFYDAYQAAMEAETVSERHALLAVAEAKALEAAGGTPMYGPVAGYIMTRSVYHSTGYAPWRGTMTDYSQQVLTNEIITAEDNEQLKVLCRDLAGTGN